MARILIVDDEEMVRFTLAMSLRRYHHEVLEAADGDIALKLINERKVDLVVTDIMMPNREGIATIQEIRAKWPDLKIIAMSRDKQPGKLNYLKIAEMTGADLTLEKPFSIDDFNAKITEILA